MAKKELNVNGVLVRLAHIHDKDYVSITDIARNFGEPSDLIKNWIRTRSTIEYLGLWEGLENDHFNSVEFDRIKTQAGLNRFVMTPTQWVNRTHAIGIKPGKRGKYSKGTFAQKDIALHFCYWIEPTFQLYMIREFERLKTAEQLQLGDPFHIKRHLTSGNYAVLVHSILSQVDERLLTHPQPYKKRLPFAAEADMINEIVFGQTAKEWRRKNTNRPADRNQRDYASVLDLTVLNNLEFLDAMLIQWDVVDLKERRQLLQDAYDFIYPILKRSKTIKDLQKLADQKDK